MAHRVKLPGPLGRYKVYYDLLTARGWNAYKRNELNAEKITNMSLRLNYEAVVQYADIEDNDLLYFSYANQVRAERFHADRTWGVQWGFVLARATDGHNATAASEYADTAFCSEQLRLTADRKLADMGHLAMADVSMLGTT